MRLIKKNIRKGTNPGGDGMRFIGITGGVGAGKSAILTHLASKPGIRVMLADEIAHDLMQPGTECFQKLKEKFAGEDIYQPDGSFDRAQLAAVIFSDDRKREELNAIVHPAVREYVLQQKEAEERAGKLFLLVLEAALLIEEHYDEICDELWYIYTTEENRRARLKASRGYSDAHVDRIFASQLSEEEYRRHCRVVIDNNGTLEETLTQTEEALRREAYE
jgi:dephospho-CoA kinase